ncbi:MAG: helix-turn-helix domain-containing protein [Chloroflexota bacterium]
MIPKIGTSGGNRLKALREYVGRTQLDVELDASLGMGYLQRVESGKVRHPERDTLERILAALGARYTERRDILELFGYVVDAPLPDESEIQWAIEACHNDLENAIFPAYLLDCAHRLLAWNALVPKLFRFKEAADTIYRVPTTTKRFSMLRVIFDEAYGIAPLIANPDVFFPAQIRALRYEMSHFQGAEWSAGVLDDLLTCATFARYWTQAESEPLHPVAARPLAPFEINLPNVGLLQFRLVSEPFASDRRFRVLYYLPADPATMGWCLGRSLREDKTFNAKTQSDKMRAKIDYNPCK